MPKGQRYLADVRETRDERTGALVRQITDGNTVSHHLYFLNPSWMPDGQMLIFSSYQSGSPNLFRLDETTGEVMQLTDTPGFGGFAACPARDGQRVFYNAFGEVRAVYVETLEEDVLASFPGGRVGGCSLSTNGERLVTSLYKDGRSAVIAVNTDGSGHRVVIEPPRAVGHVQVCPADPDLILYSSDVNQRMWLVRVDGTGDQPLYLHDRTEWITHESFLGQSDEVIFSHWPFALKAIRPGEQEARIVAGFNVWHPASNADGSRIVCDTTCPDLGIRLIDPDTGQHRPLCFPQSSNGGTQWAEVVPADDNEVRATTYGSQWSHPHPSFSPDGTRVVYTSDRTGISQVYVVDVPR